MQRSIEVNAVPPEIEAKQRGPMHSFKYAVLKFYVVFFHLSCPCLSKIISIDSIALHILPTSSPKVSARPVVDLAPLLARLDALERENAAKKTIGQFPPKLTLSAALRILAHRQYGSLVLFLNSKIFRTSRRLCSRDPQAGAGTQKGPRHQRTRVSSPSVSLCPLATP